VNSPGVGGEFIVTSSEANPDPDDREQVSRKVYVPPATRISAGITRGKVMVELDDIDLVTAVEAIVERYVELPSIDQTAVAVPDDFI